MLLEDHATGSLDHAITASRSTTGGQLSIETACLNYETDGHCSAIRHDGLEKVCGLPIEGTRRRVDVLEIERLHGMRAVRVGAFDG